MLEKAAFAAGCFWHVEAAFSEKRGVISATSGYMGGSTKNPSYEEVCSDKTGHAEAVYVEFDPKKITYEELLEVFWKIHDPTQLNRQGPDEGTQYRSAIFYYSPEQKKKAELSAKQEWKKRKKKIVTQIAPAKEFYKAEEYHQKYYQKHGKVCGI